MISFEKILVLEQKIEGAVAKIEQLTAENDALRRKCAELTNALSAKTEQLSAFQEDQNRIESGIIKALEQLDSISGKRSESAEISEDSGQPSAEAQDEQNEESSDSEGDPAPAESGGWDVEPEEESEDGESDAETSEEPTVSIEGNPENSENGGGTDADDSERDRILDLKRRGLTVEEIAGAISRGIDEVKSVLESAGDSEKNPFDIF